MNRGDVIVLLSGGVDSSTVCLYVRDRGYRVLPHFIEYGQRAARSEWDAARAVARRLRLDPPSSTDLSRFGSGLAFGLMRGSKSGSGRSSNDPFVPHRNLLLATCAAMIAASRGVPAIALGVIGSTDRAYPDTTPAFVRRLSQLLRMSANVRVLAPFADKTKTDVVRYGWQRDFDYRLTYSCHRRSGTHCGRCAGCIERRDVLSFYPPSLRTNQARAVLSG